MSTVSQGPRGENRGADDVREAFFNGGNVGPATAIQLPLNAITGIDGIVFDIDPGGLVRGNSIFPPDDDPIRFLAGIDRVLRRHPLLRWAEVRATGTGLHAILRLEGGVELHTDADRDRWENIAVALQCSFPIDPASPGLLRLSRPAGAVNLKNGRPVLPLREGRPVPTSEVERFVGSLSSAPFRVIADVLLGSEGRDICPYCREYKFGIHARWGTCCACKRVDSKALMSLVLAMRGGTPSGSLPPDGAPSL